MHAPDLLARIGSWDDGEGSVSRRLARAVDAAIVALDPGVPDGTAHHEPARRLGGPVAASVSLRGPRPGPAVTGPRAGSPRR
jgi:hypothetical protein